MILKHVTIVSTDTIP